MDETLTQIETEHRSCATEKPIACLTTASSRVSGQARRRTVRSSEDAASIASPTLHWERMGFGIENPFRQVDQTWV